MATTDTLPSPSAAAKTPVVSAWRAERALSVETSVPVEGSTKELSGRAERHHAAVAAARAAYDEAASGR